MIHKSVVAVKTHDFVSVVFVMYLFFFFEGMIWGFTKNLSGSTGLEYYLQFSLVSLQTRKTIDSHAVGPP